MEGKLEKEEEIHEVMQAVDEIKTDAPSENEEVTESTEE